VPHLSHCNEQLQRVVGPDGPAAHKIREIRQNFFNRVSDNNRAASVYGDDAKSKNPGGLARISGQMNSLRTAIEFRADDRSYSHWRRHSHWTEQDGQKKGATSFS
jgi:hypothetical protein